MIAPAWLGRLKPDSFTLMLVGTVALASVLPCRGEGAVAFRWVTTGAIALLFFLHGAKLSREAILQGIGAWRLHLAVLLSTFALFPVLGLAARAIPPAVLRPELAQGLLFLTLLPSTVQSSIAFTSIARGNVPAAVCSASASNLLGIFVTPLLVALLMPHPGADGGQAGGVSWSAVTDIMLQLLLPFVAGHLSRPLTAGLIARHRGLVNTVDRGSILLVVYTAFSAAVVQGLWSRLSAQDLAVVVVADLLVLFAALSITRATARALGFPKADEITLVFCGSKKSLASGVPMAGVLFPAPAVGLLITPLMLFHQLQLMACAVIARRYAARPEGAAAGLQPAGLGAGALAGAAGAGSANSPTA